MTAYKGPEEMAEAFGLNRNDHDLLFIDEKEKEDEILKLRKEIRYCRDQKGDDRCWMDLERLYKLLPEGYTPPVRDTLVQLEHCKKYIESCNNPSVEYVSPQRRIEELEQQVAQLTKYKNMVNAYYG